MQYQSNLLVSFTGSVLWVPPAIYKSSCSINVQYFPFDIQTCALVFGSWTYSEEEVKLVVLLQETGLDIDLSDYVQSGTWDLIDVSSDMSVHMDRTPHTTDVTFFITVR